MSEASIDEVELAERPLPFSEGLTLVITSVGRVKTQRFGYDGVRVQGLDEQGNKYGEMLWISQPKNPDQKPIVGPNSKLGAFIRALGKDLEKWVGRKIYISRWRPKDREITVVEEKKVKK